MSTLPSANVSTPQPSKPAIVPLARDEHGRTLAVPPEAAFWRVRRHTRGRPRNVTGADRQPLRVPLEFTAEDLDAMLGAGTYRLDLCDAAGEPLGMTVMVALGEAEPVNANEPTRQAQRDARDGGRRRNAARTASPDEDDHRRVRRHEPRHGRLRP